MGLFLKVLNTFGRWARRLHRLECKYDDNPAKVITMNINKLRSVPDTLLHLFLFLRETLFAWQNIYLLTHLYYLRSTVVGPQ